MTIFSQWLKVIKGEKDETRRLALDTDHTWMCGFTHKPDPRRNGIGFPAYSSIHAASGRVKWEQGKTYPIIPKRGHFQLWHKFKDGELYHSLEYAPDMRTRISYAQKHALELVGDSNGWREVLLGHKYQPSYIEAVALHREQLQDITEEDAIAEGVSSVDEYHELWQSINGKKSGARWQDNPSVYVVKFKVVGGSLKDHIAALEGSN